MVLTSGICECQKNSCTMYNNVKHVRMSNAKIKGPLFIYILCQAIDFGDNDNGREGRNE